ncbi:hypothetical protein BSKO_07214 [Bryopsis sp. KO-2023]|nr:hypothetical protein BSKO_07214 [Bryopsis sp. KO-2023]
MVQNSVPCVSTTPRLFFRGRVRTLVGRSPGPERDVACFDSETDTSLITLSEEEKYYHREIRQFATELNAACPSDFYELLGLDVGASRSDVRASYKAIQKIVHPDIAGASANALAILLNSAYKLLMDDDLRAAYDADLQVFRTTRGKFDGSPVSEWMGSAAERRAVFVDETTCIGCRNCTLCAPNTFAMEDLWGRARVSHQWADDVEEIKEAVDMCPVDCIFFVAREQLALLEFVMKSCHREDAAILARRRSGNMGPAASGENPFTRAEEFLKHRKDVKVDDVGSRVSSNLQDDMLAAAIAKAWLQLPEDVRRTGWGSWMADTVKV